MDGSVAYHIGHRQWMVAQTPTNLAMIYSHQNALKYVDSCRVLSADVPQPYRPQTISATTTSATRKDHIGQKE